MIWLNMSMKVFKGNYKLYHFVFFCLFFSFFFEYELYLFYSKLLFLGNTCYYLNGLAIYSIVDEDWRILKNLGKKKLFLNKMNVGFVKTKIIYHIMSFAHPNLTSFCSDTFLPSTLSSLLFEHLITFFSSFSLFSQTSAFRFSGIKNINMASYFLASYQITLISAWFFSIHYSLKPISHPELLLSIQIFFFFQIQSRLHRYLLYPCQPDSYNTFWASHFGKVCHIGCWHI